MAPTEKQIIGSIEYAKRQITEDIEYEGVAPETVASFAELHDYVDANEYGGLCDPLSPLCPPLADDATDAQTVDAIVTAGNRVQNALDEWIKAGRPASPYCSACGAPANEEHDELCFDLRGDDAIRVAYCPECGADPDDMSDVEIDAHFKGHVENTLAS